MIPGLEDVQPPLMRTPVAGQLLPPLPLDQLLIQDQGLLLPQQAQSLLVLLGQVLHTWDTQHVNTHNRNTEKEDEQNLGLFRCL